MKLWLARDRSGALFVYSELPVRKENLFLLESRSDDPYAPRLMVLDENSYPEVTWENSPIEVKLSIDSTVTLNAAYWDKLFNEAVVGIVKGLVSNNELFSKLAVESERQGVDCGEAVAGSAIYLADIIINLLKIKGG